MVRISDDFYDDRHENRLVEICLYCQILEFIYANDFHAEAAEMCVCTHRGFTKSSPSISTFLSGFAGHCSSEPSIPLASCRESYMLC